MILDAQNRHRHHADPRLAVADFMQGLPRILDRDRADILGIVRVMEVNVGAVETVAHRTDGLEERRAARRLWLFSWPGR